MYDCVMTKKSFPTMEQMIKTFPLFFGYFMLPTVKENVQLYKMDKKCLHLIINVLIFLTKRKSFSIVLEHIFQLLMLMMLADMWKNVETIVLQFISGLNVTWTAK